MTQEQGDHHLLKWHESKTTQRLSYFLKSLLTEKILIHVVKKILTKHFLGEYQRFNVTLTYWLSSWQRRKQLRRRGPTWWWWCVLGTWSWRMTRGPTITSSHPLASWTWADVFNRERGGRPHLFPVLTFAPLPSLLFLILVCSTLMVKKKKMLGFKSGAAKEVPACGMYLNGSAERYRTPSERSPLLDC